MNDICKSRPPELLGASLGVSLAEAQARLTAPGALFETHVRLIRGVATTVWTHVPATAAQAFARARAFGPREFLVYQDSRVTYDGFARAVAAVANHLVARGVMTGDRVAVAMKNQPEWPVAFLGALLAGAIAVPLNAWWTADELAYALSDSGARLVFVDPERCARLAGLPITLLDVNAIAGEAAQWGDLPDAPLPPVALDPEDDATLFYTSGTSGLPKGALGTHRALTTNIFAAPFVQARNELRRGQARDSDRQKVTLLAVPFFHVIGSLSILLPNMAAGGKLVLMPRFEAAAALDLIARERVSVAGGVPAIALSLLEHAPGHDLSSLELVSFGGAPCSAALAARIKDELGAWPGQGWGMTETSATCTSHSAEDYLAHPESCGPALPVCRLKVMRDGVAAPPGAIGELWAFGPNIVKGYWNRPDDTAAVFRDGWINTGDLASLDEDGFLTIHDRAHDMVIRGGENIYCIEVENILGQHPAVADAALVGLPHPLLGEVPAALVQARGPVSQEALRAFAAQRLAAFKVPVEVMISTAPLPRNAGGKLIKRDVRKVFGA
ncbi:MAG TPA: AMP-binding protein [Rhizomicrobium sp.]|nr:AMP-binding protein [Rhizomicrobium sp.]